MSGIEIIRPKDRSAWLAARGQDVTASQIGALFGAHDFLTAFGLWAMKTGRVAAAEVESPAMERGRLLEPVAVQLLREKYPRWKITHNAAENVYFRDPAARLGATPDVLVKAPDRGPGVVQIKSVEASVFRRKWIDEDGNVEPPLWIALQATLEAFLTGGQWAAVAPLVIGHGLEMPLVDIPLVEGVVDAMKVRTAEFWQMVEEGREPQPDFDRDAGLIDRLYGNGDPEHEIDLTGDNEIPVLLELRRRYSTEAREAQAGVDRIDAQIKSKMAQAHVAHIAGGQKITWKPQKRAGSFVEPKTIRALRYPAEKD